MKFVPIIFVLFALGIFFAYVNPTYSTVIRDLEGDIEEFDRIIATAEQFEQEQNRLEAARAQIPAHELDRLRVLLPDNVNTVQLILDISSIADANGVRINDIGVAQEQESQVQTTGQGVALGERRQPYSSLIMSFALTGTYEQFKQFLLDTEQSLRLIDVTEIDFEISETGVYNYDVRARVYWLQ